jgi:hypothetical protein
VRVGPDERVGERAAVPRLDHTREVLEVHLVDDPGAGWHDLQVGQRLLPPLQEGVALAVPLELELDVAREREPVGELVDLDRVVDHELRRDHRVDLRRVAAQILHGVPHRGEVDDRRDAGEVLVDHAARAEGDLAARLAVRDPAGDRLGVRLALGAEDVLEQHAQRVRQACDVPALLQRIQPEDLVALASDA